MIVKKDYFFIILLEIILIVIFLVNSILYTKVIEVVYEFFFSIIILIIISLIQKIFLINYKDEYKIFLVSLIAISLYSYGYIDNISIPKFGTITHNSDDLEYLKIAKKINSDEISIVTQLNLFDDTYIKNIGLYDFGKVLNNSGYNRVTGLLLTFGSYLNLDSPFILIITNFFIYGLCIITFYKILIIYTNTNSAYWISIIFCLNPFLLEPCSMIRKDVWLLLFFLLFIYFVIKQDKFYYIYIFIISYFSFLFRDIQLYTNILIIFTLFLISKLTLKNKLIINVFIIFILLLSFSDTFFDYVYPFKINTNSSQTNTYIDNATTTLLLNSSIGKIFYSLFYPFFSLSVYDKIYSFFVFTKLYSVFFNNIFFIIIILLIISNIKYLDSKLLIILLVSFLVVHINTLIATKFEQLYILEPRYKIQFFSIAVICFTFVTKNIRFKVKT